MITKHPFRLAAIAALCALGAGCNSPLPVVTQARVSVTSPTRKAIQPPKKALTWPEKAALVKISMKRAEVEKLLPPRDGVMIFGEGGAYVAFYGLDSHWGARVVYRNIQNKVLEKPVLTRGNYPPFKRTFTSAEGKPKLRSTARPKRES